MRTALGGGGGGACLRNLRHSFLSVTIQVCDLCGLRHMLLIYHPAQQAAARCILPLRSAQDGGSPCRLGPQSPGGSSVEYVVDPRFREQFEIAHATPRYVTMLAGLGPELVATPDRLNKVGRAVGASAPVPVPQLPALV